MSAAPASVHFLGWSTARELHRLARTPEERDAVDRLADFEGSPDDLETAARLYRDAGEHGLAAGLLRSL